MTIETPTTAVDGSQLRSPRTPDVMTDHEPGGLPPQPPNVTAPRPFVDRRESYRRTEDRVAHQEKVLLARALDILASDAPAEERLAGLLRLLARTAGARRAAVVADGNERRVAVAVDPGEDPGEAQALAAWLDANAPRSRAERAATGLAPISFIVGSAEHRNGARANGSSTNGNGTAAGNGLTPEAPRPQPIRAPVPEVVDATSRAADGSSAAPHGDSRAPHPPAEPIDRHYAMLPIPTAGGVVLGFAFSRAADAKHLPVRLPPTMARHAGVALALVTGQLAGERDLASLRVREVERSRFVSTVAHELRTPLTGLRGYLDLILEGEVPDAADEREFLERSRSIVSTMDELVGDLLELSRLESNSINLEIGPFSIAEAASQVASNLLPIAIDRDIRLTTALPPRLRAATGDRRRVEQILTNLAANALKFTPRGGTVEIIGRVDGLAAVFIVRDDGDGVPAEDRDRIFQPFQRLAGHHGVTGTGLGLPIARDLARRMGGDLDLASVTDSGSAFVLVLPGPAEIDPRVIAGTLSQTLEREEIGLEERAVRRAMGLLPGGAPTQLPTARPSITQAQTAGDDAGASNGRTADETGANGGNGGNGLHHPKLRALPSVRDDRPSPA